MCDELRIRLHVPSVVVPVRVDWGRAEDGKVARHGDRGKNQWQDAASQKIERKENIATLLALRRTGGRSRLWPLPPKRQRWGRHRVRLCPIWAELTVLLETPTLHLRQGFEGVNGVKPA